MNSAIYPGTFDPITYGHLDLIERVIKIFDRVVVAVGHNPEKKPLFSVEERVGMIREVTAQYDRVEVTRYDGLLVDFARQRRIYTVVRSLRSTTEFELELSTAFANRELVPEFEAVFLTPSLEYNYLSSTIVRQIAQFGGDLSPFVPPPVAEKLQAKF